MTDGLDASTTEDLSSSRNSSSASGIEILPPVIVHQRDHVQASVELRIGKRREELWYRFPRSCEPCLSDCADPFLLAALFPAMRQGRDITVHGKVSSTLLANLGHYQDTWNQWEPKAYRKTSIHADEITPPHSATKAHVAMMFSGGLDSCHTLWKHTQVLETPSLLKPEAALFVHGFDIPLEKSEIYNACYPKAKEVTDSVGVEMIWVRTNFRKVIGDWVNSHGLALASCLHLLSAHFTTGLIASSHAYNSLRLPWGSNPVTDPLMSSDRMRIINDGGEWSRWEKAAQVADWSVAMKDLRVCYKREGLGHNCGVCDNCSFTALCFVAAGKEIPPSLNTGDPAKAVANLRKQAITRVGVQRMDELMAYARQTGVQGPWFADLQSCHRFHQRRVQMPKPIGKLALWWDRHRNNPCS